MSKYCHTLTFSSTQARLSLAMIEKHTALFVQEIDDAKELAMEPGCGTKQKEGNVGIWGGVIARHGAISPGD